MRRMRWAALLLVTVGAGYLGNQMRQSGAFEFDGLPLPASSTDSSPGAVLSSEEAVAPADPDTSTPERRPKRKTGQAKARSVPKRVAPRAEAPASRASARAGHPLPLPLPRTANEEPESSGAAGMVGEAGNRRTGSRKRAMRRWRVSRHRSSSSRTCAPRPPVRSRSWTASGRWTAPMRPLPRSTARVGATRAGARAAAAPAPGAPHARAAGPDLSPDRPRRGRQAVGPPGARDRRNEPALHGSRAGENVARRRCDAPRGACGISGFPGEADSAGPAAAPARPGHQLAGGRAALDRGRDLASPER